MPRQQLTRDDWIEAALDALADGGVAALRVDVLAKRLGITRGSFYWHFADRDALLGAALEEWERTVTTETIEQLERIASPHERYREIVRAAYFGRRDRNRVEPALAAHADHPLIAPVLSRVTERRLGFLTDLFADLGLPRDVARQRALVAYGTYVGWLQLRRTTPATVPEILSADEQADSLSAHLSALMLSGVSPDPAALGS